MTYVEATFCYNKEMFNFIIPFKGKDYAHCAKGLWHKLDKSVPVATLVSELKHKSFIAKSEPFNIPFGPAEPIFKPGIKKPMYCVNIGITTGVCTLAEASGSILMKSHYSQLKS